MGIILGMVVRFVLLVIDSPFNRLFSDPKRHWDNAQRLFHPQLMGGCDPIFYQVYLYLIKTLSANSHLGIAIMTGLLSASMPWLYYRAARALNFTKNSSLIYAFLIAWLPSFLEIYQYFMMETLLLPLIGLSLWMTGRALRKRDLLSFYVMAICWMLACLTKPQAIPMALICWGYVWVKLHYNKKALMGMVLIIAIMLVPNLIRSWSILGYPAPLGSGYIAQIMHRSGEKHTRIHWNGGTWIYSSPSCYIRPFEPLNYWMIERGYKEDIHDITIDRNKGRMDWELALQNVRPSFKQQMQNLAENIALFLHAPSWPDSGSHTWMGWLNYHSRWLWAPLIFLVIAENLLYFKRRCFELIPILGTVVTLLFLFQNSVTMEGRYRKPLEPILLLNLIWLSSYARGGTMSKKPNAQDDLSLGSSIKRAD